MRTDALLCLGTALLSVVTAAPTSTSTATSDATRTNHTTGGTPAPDAFNKLHDTYVKNTKAVLPKGSCSSNNIAIRKAWDDLCTDERKDYLRAVNCMAAKPANTDKTLCPGCVNRLDDFTYIHINQTNIIHNSGSLLSWHRQFLFGMEKALRDECQYKGWLPYWDTGRYADDQTKSPVFDGSETSFGGDGAPSNKTNSVGYIPGLAAGPKSFPLPIFASGGGGCLTDGPFKNMTLSLGPVVVANPIPNNLYGLQPNHRCMSRDLNKQTSAGNLTWDRITELSASPNITDMRTTLEPTLHLMGHLSIGGEGADPFTPCNDPAFYLFHAQIDRVWAIWQGQNLKNRTYAIDGPRTFFGQVLADDPNANPPGNSSAAITDIMKLGTAGGNMPISAAMSTTDNGRCYMYM